MKSRLLVYTAVTALCVTFAACGNKRVVAKAPAQPAPEQTKPAAVFTPGKAPAPAPQERSATFTPSRTPDAETIKQIKELLSRIQDAYFDYDQHTLRPDAEAALKTDAQTLADIIKQYPDFKLTVQGFADERGSDEYNLALGDARAKQAKEYLSTLGLPGNQLATISYGKDKPVCAEHDEDCWQKNRRAHITAAP